MSPALLLAGILLVLIGALHSWLGERMILGPLCAADWPRVALNIRFAKRVLRFAWHVTTIAWVMAGVGLAWAAFGEAPVLLLVAVAVLATGGVIYASSRGAHFAWPVFLLAGAAILYAALPEWWQPMRQGLAAFCGAALLIAAAIHAYWAMGGRSGFAPAIPTDTDGRPSFQPRPALTAVVAGALAIVGLGFWSMIGWPAFAGTGWLRAGFALLALLFAARLVGDFRHVGLFKRLRGSAFARSDDALYGPLLFVFMLGAAALALP